jgi:predicted HD superfamily hydrolase involved in NAD metabolism
MIEDIKAKVSEKLKNHQKRLQHVFGVYETAVKIANAHHLDVHKVSMAALYHDYAKYDTIEQQVEHLEIKIIKEFAETPVIYHAFAGAIALEHDFGIKDQDVLNAIRYHVWGRKNMSAIEKVIFIADCCEPNREFEDAKKIFDMALINLDQTVVYCMKIGIDHVIHQKFQPSRDQLEAYEYYMEVNRGEIK